MVATGLHTYFDRTKCIEPSINYSNNTLLKLVKLIDSVKRETDTFCRWGGDEFLLLMPKTTIDEANQAADRLRLALREVVIDRDTPLQCSIGVSVLSESEESIEYLSSRADKALFSTKQAKRNQVEISAVVNNRQLH